MTRSDVYIPNIEVSSFKVELWSSSGSLNSELIRQMCRSSYKKKSGHCLHKVRVLTKKKLINVHERAIFKNLFPKLK